MIALSQVLGQDGRAVAPLPQVFVSAAILHHWYMYDSGVPSGSSPPEAVAVRLSFVIGAAGPAVRKKLEAHGLQDAAEYPLPARKLSDLDPDGGLGIGMAEVQWRSLLEGRQDAESGEGSCTRLGKPQSFRATWFSGTSL